MAELIIVYDGPIVSRQDAKKEGLKRYFTGKSCSHGHVAQRWTSATGCTECVRIRRVANPDANYARVKAWRAANPEKWAEHSKRYAQKYPEKRRAAVDRYIQRNPEKVKAQSAAWHRNRRKSDPEGNRRRVAAFKARSELVLAEIAGRPRPKICDLCHEESKIVFDHCHMYGQFRGWICDRCNKVLGLVKDSNILLAAMAKYVEDANGKTNERKEE